MVNPIAEIFATILVFMWDFPLITITLICAITVAYQAIKYEIYLRSGNE